MLQFITHNNGRIDEIEGTRLALEGGCRWIQLRMKNSSDNDFIRAGKVIGRMCREAGATFIVDDRVDMVDPLDADGVHLGKLDMPPSEARQILGSEKIIGATANTLGDALRGVDEGADYLGIGPFRFTTTKEKLSPVLGCEGLSTIMKELRKRSEIPVVAIGGITLADIKAIMHTGVTGIAVSSLILNSSAPLITTEKIIDILNNG